MFTYQYRIDKSRLVFLVAIEWGNILVIFTQQYSAEVHQLCAKAGVLLCCVYFSGWHMVVECLEPTIDHSLKAGDCNLMTEFGQMVKILHNRGIT